MLFTMLMPISWDGGCVNDSCRPGDSTVGTLTNARKHSHTYTHACTHTHTYTHTQAHTCRHTYTQIERVAHTVRSALCAGRPEKLPDVCYSWWVLASLQIIGRIHWISKVCALTQVCLLHLPANTLYSMYTYMGAGGIRESHLLILLAAVGPSVDCMLSC